MLAQIAQLMLLTGMNEEIQKKIQKHSTITYEQNVGQEIECKLYPTNGVSSIRKINSN